MLEFNILFYQLAYRSFLNITVLHIWIVII